MKRIWVRPFRKVKEEYEQFLLWFRSTINNLYDEDILQYPATQVLVAHNDKTIMFLPFQQTVMLESLAIDPEASPKDVAVSLYALIDAVRLKCAESGIGELYFLCKDESTSKFAERHGFTRLEYPIFRMKLNDN
jgi:N-acetylglutamate synthase-like GNAT family acetyltransferase